MNSRTVIVGSSVGGVRTAQELRSSGYDGSVVVLGEEDHLPYSKPPLSKGLLANAMGLDHVQLISKSEADSADIEFWLGSTAKGLDVVNQEVVLDGGKRVFFDNLVVATGARARPSPWHVSNGVHVLRSLDDCLALKGDLRVAESIVVIGGGFIGAEVAATARLLGLDVTIVDPLPIPMGRVLGDEVGERFIGLHHENNVATHFGIDVESIEKKSNNLQVRLSDGTILLASVVVVGIGAIPNTEWLLSSGLLVDNGLICDEYCRAVGKSNIYGVGDVARWFHPRYGELVRVEHWTNAVEQAACVAHNITDFSNLKPYDPVEYAWSDQYDWKIQIIGRTAKAARHLVVSGLESSNSFVALYGDGAGNLCGAVAVNWPRALMKCRRLLSTDVNLSVPIEQVQLLLLTK